MLKLIFGVIAFLGLILLTVAAVGLKFLRQLFSPRSGTRHTQNGDSHRQSAPREAYDRGKVFGQNEGEYVEFEEVKDDAIVSRNGQ